jgi:hypothetical protein
MRSWLADPAFAGSVSPCRSCLRRICFALPILPSPDLFRLYHTSFYSPGIISGIDCRPLRR